MKPQTAGKDEVGKLLSEMALARPAQGWSSQTPRWSERITASCLEQLLQSLEESKYLGRIKGKVSLNRLEKRKNSKQKSEQVAKAQLFMLLRTGDLELYLLPGVATCAFPQTQENVLSLVRSAWSSRVTPSPSSTGVPAL